LYELGTITFLVYFANSGVFINASIKSLESSVEYLGYGLDNLWFDFLQMQVIFLSLKMFTLALGPT
jgi:hypothetical protein